MCAYSLIATDLDGTLLRSDDSVSPRTRAALAAAREAGAQHVVVTGRPVAQTRHILQDLGHQGLAVCGQGAQVLDVASDRVLASVTMEAEVARAAVEKIEAEVGEVFAAVNLPADVPVLTGPGYRIMHPTLPVNQVGRPGLWQAPVLKVLLQHPRLSDDELTVAARQAAGHMVSVTMAGRHLVELQPLGIDKAAGLAVAASHLGVPAASVIAFGDMPNDIPMFAWAAHGVAMADAHPHLVAVADEITLSHDADGVAHVLERLYPADGRGR